MEEDDGGDNTHATETIGWVAFTAGTGTNNGSLFEIASVSNVDENPDTINFTQAYTGSPLFIAWLQSYNDDDPAGVRYDNLAAGSVDIFVEEDTVTSGSKNHGNEDVGYLAWNTAGTILGSLNPHKWDLDNDVGQWSIDSSSRLDSADPSNTHYFLDQNAVKSLSNFECEMMAYSPFDGSIWNFFMTLRQDPADIQRRIVIGAREGADAWRIQRFTSATAQTNLSSFNEVIDRGIWYKVKVRLEGEVITLWIDDVQKMTYTMVGVETGWDTIVGFSNHNSHALFDDIKLRHYINPEPTVQLLDPWEPGVYQNKRQLTLTNQMAGKILPVGYSVRVDVSPSLQADGDDIRIVYWNGSSFEELDRVNTTAWSPGPARVYFALKKAIPASGTDSDYYLYVDKWLVFDCIKWDIDLPCK